MPMTEMSSVIRNPARRSVRMAPTATSSECAYTAVGGSRKLSSWLMASAPCKPTQSTVVTRLGSAVKPGGAGDDGPVGRVGFDRGDHGDAPVAEEDQGVHGLPGGPLVVDSHVGVGGA